MSLPCHEIKQEEVKKQQVKEEPTKENVVVISDFSLKKSIKPSDIPPHVQAYLVESGIENQCAYWGKALREGWSSDILEKANERQAKKEALERMKAEETARKIKEQKELEELKNKPPFWETCSREQAIHHLRAFKNGRMRQLLKTGYRAELIEKFKITEDELLA